MQKEPMTKYGYEKLSNELNHLKLVERPEIIKEIEVAKEHGDLKENAEYHAGKEKQRNVDLRLTELAKIIGNAQIIEPETLAHERVSFGSTIILCDMDTDEEIKYTIVGVAESSPENGLISFHSPLSKTLLGKAEGDEVIARLPGGKKEYELMKVCYEEIIFAD